MSDNRSPLQQHQYHQQSLTSQPLQNNGINHGNNYSMSLPPKSMKPGSRPLNIPTNQGSGRPRSRSDHIYSKSEGHSRGATAFQWPSDKYKDELRTRESPQAAPFLFVDSSSLNSESSLNAPVEYRLALFQPFLVKLSYSCCCSSFFLVIKYPPPLTVYIHLSHMCKSIVSLYVSEYIVRH